MKITGQTALITGGCGGIGLASAQHFLAQGKRVILLDREIEKGRRVLNDHKNAKFVQVDLADRDALAGVLNALAAEGLSPDVLVNNAGAIMLQPTELLPVKRFDLIFGINVRAVYLCAQACIPHLKRSSNGHILNLSPPISLEPRWFVQHTPYTTSKFAMSLMTYGLAAELKDVGVAANSLWPRTLIATAAVEWLGGDALINGSRTPEIMADAAYQILTSDARTTSGQFFIDEVLLRESGQTDFDHYAARPGHELIPDLFVPGQ